MVREIEEFVDGVRRGLHPWPTGLNAYCPNYFYMNVIYCFVQSSNRSCTWIEADVMQFPRNQMKKSGLVLDWTHMKS